MIQKFADTVYVSPNGWGEEVVADSETTDTYIDELHQMADGWEKCDKSECDEFDFVAAISDDMAIYERQHVRKTEFCVFRNIGNGYYEQVYQKPGRPAQFFCTIENVANEAKDFLGI